MGVRNWAAPDWENWDEIPKGVIAIAMDKSGQINGFTTPPAYVPAPAVWAATKRGKKSTLGFIALMGDDATNQGRAGRSCVYRPGHDPGKDRPRPITATRPDFKNSTSGQQVEPGKRPEPIIAGAAPGNSLPVARTAAVPFDVTDDLAFSGRVNRAPLVALGVTPPVAAAADPPKAIPVQPSALEAQVAHLAQQLGEVVALLASTAKKPAKKTAKSKPRRK